MSSSRKINYTDERSEHFLFFKFEEEVYPHEQRKDPMIMEDSWSQVVADELLPPLRSSLPDSPEIKSYSGSFDEKIFQSMKLGK